MRPRHDPAAAAATRQPPSLRPHPPAARHRDRRDLRCPGLLGPAGPGRRHHLLLQRRRGPGPPGRAGHRPAPPARHRGARVGARSATRWPSRSSSPAWPSVSATGVHPELFADGIPVVLEGAFAPGTDTLRQRPDPGQAHLGVPHRGGRPPRPGRDPGVPAVNAALGTAGVMLGFVGAVLGVVVLAAGLNGNRPDRPRRTQRARAVVAGSLVRLAGAGWGAVGHRGHGDRPGHPRLLPGLRGRQRLEVDSAALHSGVPLGAPGRLHSAVGAGARRLSHGHGPPLPPPGQRPAGGLGHPCRLGGGGVLLRPDDRPGQPLPGGGRPDPPMAPGPTRCSRTTP